MSPDTARPRRSRKSIAVMPTASESAPNKENALSVPEQPAKHARKARSKSLGPGGLDGLNEAAGEGRRGPLKDGSGNGRRASLAPVVQVKSILKPTLPLSPIQPIPAHRPRPRQQPAPPTPLPQATIAPSQTLNFDPPPQRTTGPATIPVRTEEEQQRRAEILAARAARRQSLGNRRVSFAPEATLHTWDVVEYYRGEDGSSTPGSSVGGSSAASTPASNRRKSDSWLPSTAATPTPAVRPATPPEQVEQEPPETPPNARMEHQKKNRRESEIPPLNFNNPDDEYLTSSPVSSSPAGENLSPFAGSEAASSDLSENSDGETAEDRTFMSAAGETTLGDDDTGMMDLVDDNVTGGFKSFKKPVAWKFEGQTEVVSSPPAPAAFEEEPTLPGDDVADSEEMTMDVTRPVGGLIKPAGSEAPSRAAALLAFSPNREEEDEMTMDVTRPVGGLLQRSRMPSSSPHQQDDMTMDMDTTRPLGGILSAAAKNQEKAKRQSLTAQFSQDDDSDTDMGMDMDMTMDITRPIGGIIISQRRSEEATSMEEQKDDDTMDMDFTRPLGGILAAPPTHGQDNIQVAPPTPITTSEMDDNEDMTMEFTSVLGGIVAGSKQETRENGRRSSISFRRRSSGALMSGEAWAKDQAEKQAMQEQKSEVDTTAEKRDAVPFTADSGRASLPNEFVKMKAGSPAVQDAAPEEADDQGEDTEEEGIDMDGVTMDITSSIGTILARSNKALNESKLKELEEQSSAAAPSPAGLEQAVATGSPIPRRKNPSRRSSTASVSSEKRVTRRSSAARQSFETAHRSSPLVKVQTPPRNDLTPKKASMPAKATPEPTPKVSTPQKAATPKPVTPPHQLTPLVPNTKPKTPSKDTPRLETPIRSNGDATFSLSAKKRLGFQASPSPVKLSSTPKLGTPGKGFGIDKAGLGSPVVAAKLSRRKSLGEDAPIFSPVAIPSELLRASQEDKEQEEKEVKEEKARRAEEQSKMDLRSKINLLTPRKAGRKSIAFGSLLHGKRPSEEELGSVPKRRRSLDAGMLLEEEEELLSMSARKFGRHAVLPTPGSGRKTPKKNVAVVRVQTPSRASAKTPVKSPAKTPAKVPLRTSPRNKPEPAAPTNVEKPAEELHDESANGEQEDSENISIQNFLDIVGIAFMDGLTTTKRRHTVFNNKRGVSELDESEEASLADCVAAGACTVPMLDLFQHSCRELRKYIKEGREVVREIEKDTLEENPLLFREYLYAPPDVRLLMDSQFKDIKTHARLLAKGIWYDWRMKLLEGVRGGLEANLQGLKEDEEIIKTQRETLEPIMPEIINRWNEVNASLEKALQMQKRIERDDQEELKAARDRLVNVTQRVEVLTGKVQEKRNTVTAVENEIKVRKARKEELKASIEEAERVKELNRGWSEEEVQAWKEKCENLEKWSGWSITRVLDKSKLEMKFRGQLKLICDPQGGSSPVVNYIMPASQRPSDCKAIMPEAERTYFVESLNKLIVNETNSKRLLKTIANYWREALAVCENIRRLRMHHPISVTRGEQGQLRITATVLVQELRSKMEISFVVQAGNLEKVDMDVRVVYGGIAGENVKRTLAEWGGRWREGVDEVVGRCLEDRRRGGTVIAAKSG